MLSPTREGVLEIIICQMHICDFIVVTQTETSALAINLARFQALFKSWLKEYSRPLLAFCLNGAPANGQSHLPFLNSFCIQSDHISRPFKAITRGVHKNVDCSYRVMLDQRFDQMNECLHDGQPKISVSWSSTTNFIFLIEETFEGRSILKVKGLSDQAS